MIWFSVAVQGSDRNSYCYWFPFSLTCRRRSLRYTCSYREYSHNHSYVSRKSTRDCLPRQGGTIRDNPRHS